MSVLTKAQITKAEETAVQNGTFSFRDLMLTAGTTTAKIIEEKYPVKNKKIAVLCGKGNNGGDGYVIAEYLKSKGADITIIAPFGASVTENAKFYASASTCEITNDLKGDFDIIIDALFGIGFKGELDQSTAEILTKANALPCVRIAVDIPSGVECDTGLVSSTAFKADLTVTFIALKPCFLLPMGSDYCGEIIVAPIGVDTTEKTYEIIKEPVFKKRSHNSHKGTFGTALIICGSYGMAGALMLCAKSALRSGLGIAKCVMPKSIYEAFTKFLPEAVCVPSKETKTGTLKYSPLALSHLLKDANAILFGCGSGQHRNNKKILKYLLTHSENPLVIDADGINTLTSCIELLKQSKAPIILTPHPGEMARLCKVSVGEIEADRVKFAREFARKYGCTLVLKGANTIVAEKKGNLSFNILGNSGMATGGSGDVLAGITVSLCAQGYSPEDSAKNAVYLHSLAADKAVEKKSRHALLPTDIIEEL